MDGAADDDDEDGKKSTQGGYNSKYQAFLNQSYPSRFKSFRAFRAVREFYHAMQDSEIFKDYETFCGNHVREDEPC